MALSQIYEQIAKKSGRYGILTLIKNLFPRRIDSPIKIIRMESFSETINMQVLGIRTSPKTIRYAILDWDGKTSVFVNADKENKINFPAKIQTPEKKVSWLFNEFERILRQHPDVESVTIKSNEYSRGRESGSSREAAYLDGTILLASEINQKKVVMKLYKTMKTKRDDVKAFAEKNVGLSSQNWDERMADAVIAAWSSRGI